MAVPLGLVAKAWAGCCVGGAILLGLVGGALHGWRHVKASLGCLCAIGIVGEDVALASRGRRCAIQIGGIASRGGGQCVAWVAVHQHGVA